MVWRCGPNRGCCWKEPMVACIPERISLWSRHNDDDRTEGQTLGALLRQLWIRSAEVRGGEGSWGGGGGGHRYEDWIITTGFVCRGLLAQGWQSGLAVVYEYCRKHPYVSMNVTDIFRKVQQWYIVWALYYVILVIYLDGAHDDFWENG